MARRPLLAVLGCVLIVATGVSGFVNGIRSAKGCVVRDEQQRVTTVFARRQNRSRQDPTDNDGPKRTTEIPQLPPMGDSSFGLLPMVESSVVSGDAAFLNRKLGLQYTCAKCDTRNTHSVSRMALQKGVVITTCKGCQARHLIADNLGAAGNYQLEESNTVHRVSKDQFQISMLYNSYDTRSGAIVGEDGKMALE